MKKYKLTISFLLISFLNLFLTNCKKESSDNNDFYEANLKQKSYAAISTLPVDIKILKSDLGEKLEILNFIVTNLDTDIDNEFALAYKTADQDYVNIAIFDILSSGLIKKLFTTETYINNGDSLTLQSFNLFQENDIALIVEGKTKDNKFILNIIHFRNETGYKVIGEFTADYSVILDFADVETERGKYQILKDVATIENSFSYANSKIQQKTIYIWDSTEEKFKIVETDQIVATNSNFERLLYNEKDLFDYIKGFWYQEKYISLIKDKNKLAEIDVNSLEFIFFSPDTKEVNIKYDDYIAKYNILKSYKFWGQRPGISINVESIQPTTYVRHIKIDVVLLEADKIQVTGPGTFEEGIYVRFPKPLVDIIKDEKDKKNISAKEKIKSQLLNRYFIKKDSKNRRELALEFFSDNKFKLKKDSIEENGYYIILKNGEQYIIAFIIKESKLLNSTYYLIEIEALSNRMLSLIPLKINFKGFTLENPKKIVFIKDDENADKSQ